MNQNMDVKVIKIKHLSEVKKIKIHSRCTPEQVEKLLKNAAKADEHDQIQLYDSEGCLVVIDFHLKPTEENDPPYVLEVIRKGKRYTIFIYINNMLLYVASING